MSIHIKASHEGRFTAFAKAHGKSVQGEAHAIVSNPHSSVTEKRRAQFAINARKWMH